MDIGVLAIIVSGVLAASAGIFERIEKKHRENARVLHDPSLFHSKVRKKSPPFRF